jgi:hypothetical protein
MIVFACYKYCFSILYFLGAGFRSIASGAGGPCSALYLQSYILIDFQSYIIISALLLRLFDKRASVGETSNHDPLRHLSDAHVRCTLGLAHEALQPV